MRIALLGGTGDIGEGLALRWGLQTDHDIVVGSRDPQKAQQRAHEYAETVQDHGGDGTFSGASNLNATTGADVVVLSVPPEYVSETVETVSGSLAPDAVVVSPAVSMSRDADGFHYEPPAGAESVTEVVTSAVPDGVSTVGAFHNLPAGRLANLDTDLGLDTLLLADDEDAARTVSTLVEDIEGLRPVHAGPLSSAPEVEGITPLLINVAMNNDGMHHLGVRFQ